MPMDITMSEEIDQEFLEYVGAILEDSEFIKLGKYRQHQFTTRLMHSINVSYISWIIAKKLGCDAKVAARAGMLHDFCVYDFRDEVPTGEMQAFYHPKVAAKASKERFDVTEKEEHAIRAHMFPLGPLPRSKEAWIISCSDKMCACMEACHVGIALARRSRVMIRTA